MIKRTRQKGLMLIVAVVFMSLITMAVIILSASVLDLATQSFIERLRVQRTNLLVSAETWLQHNTAHFADKQPGYTLELDTSTLNISNSSCTISLTEHTDKFTALLITANMDHGRKQFSKDRIVKIELKK
jgi:Tfp pilus assembly protein PilX